MVVTSESRSSRDNEDLNLSIRAATASVDWERILLGQSESIVALDDAGRILRYHRDGTITPVT